MSLYCLSLVAPDLVGAFQRESLFKQQLYLMFYTIMMEDKTNAYREQSKLKKGTFLLSFDIRESEIDRSESLPYRLAQLERESKPRVPAGLCHPLPFENSA
jgi:hypothetical protein